MADKWDFAAHNVACNIPGDVSAAGETVIAAALRTAVAEEREACAKVCGDMAKRYRDEGDRSWQFGSAHHSDAAHQHEMARIAEQCAAAIRARTEGGE